MGGIFLTHTVDLMFQSQPISWLVQNTRPSQNYNQEQQEKPKQPCKKTTNICTNYSDLGLFYVIRPGNGSGLFYSSHGLQSA